MENRPTTTKRSELVTLFCMLALLGCLIGFINGCGTEDLTFPGDFPPTAADTVTPEPTDDPDDDE